MYIAASDLASEVGHASAVHFVYSAMARGNFMQCWPLIVAQAFDTANPMQEITHFRHYFAQHCETHILPSTTMFSSSQGREDNKHHEESC